MGKRRKVSRKSVFYSGDRKVASGAGTRHTWLWWLLTLIEAVLQDTWPSPLPRPFVWSHSPERSLWHWGPPTNCFFLHYIIHNWLDLETSVCKGYMGNLLQNQNSKRPNLRLWEWRLVLHWDLPSNDKRIKVRRSELRSQNCLSFLSLRQPSVEKGKKYIFQLTFISREYAYLYWRIPGDRMKSYLEK